MAKKRTHRDTCEDCRALRSFTEVLGRSVGEFAPPGTGFLIALWNPGAHSGMSVVSSHERAVMVQKLTELRDMARGGN